MKNSIKIVFIFCVLLVNSSKLFAQTIDSAAFKEIRQHLDLVRKFAYGQKDTSKSAGLEKICPCSNSVNFLSRITGIPSYSNANPGGRFAPSQSEYQSWLVWLENYKYYLKWDKESGSIIIHRSVSVY